MRVKLVKVLCISILFSVAVLSTVLLASEVDPNQQVAYSKYGTEIMDAIHKGNLEKIQLLLCDNKVDVDEKDKHGWSALMCAAWLGSSAAVGLLLEHEADVHQKNNRGTSALMHAANMGRLEPVRLLLAHEAKVDEQDNNGYSALATASHSGHLKVIDLLIAKGADVNLKNNKDGTTPLMDAARNARSEVVGILLENGANAKEKDHYGRTASSFALELTSCKMRSEKCWQDEVKYLRMCALETVKLLWAAE